MNREPVLRIRDYETSQLIPYLGNKRTLIPRLRQLFQSLRPEGQDCVFLDPFAGAGSVSRLARSMGLRVRANDWEPYSYTVNRSWLVLCPSDLDGMFRSEGGFAEAISRVNSFHPSRENRSPAPEPEPYMARWYAPRDTAQADWRTERLFYSRENAIFLDRVREDIARRGPLNETTVAEDPACSGRWLLLALLLLEAATHANTSGVFKAFHKGFGGHGKDALPRILGAMQLEAPILPEADRAQVFCEDAAKFVKRFPSDIAYLDPPYNQHQYGSNYHLLNTLVRWDRDPVLLDTGPDGRLIRKAGIPQCWKDTWSAYCGRATARNALVSLLDNLDTRTLVLSYNTEGIIPPEDLYEILASRWEVSTEILDYVRYRGGRQSSERRVQNHELVYIGRLRSPALHPAPLGGPERLRTELRFRRLLSARFDPERIVERFTVRKDKIEAGNGRRSWSMWRFHRFKDLSESETGEFDPVELERVLSILESCEIRGNDEAVRVLVRIAEACLRERSPCAIPDALRATREALTALRKLAHPKYMTEYEDGERWLRTLTRENPVFGGRLETSLTRLNALRAVRLKGSRASGTCAN